jgi:thiol-disulfide isomerase/thioredoxin
MTSSAILILVLALSSLFGIWYKRSRGVVKAHTAPAVSTDELGTALGSRMTLLQFSSAFCSPCRATRALLSDITKDLPDVKHIDIDAESHLELVRKLNILTTPTTLILNKEGVEVGRAVGAPKRDQVLDAISPIDI